MKIDKTQDDKSMDKLIEEMKAFSLSICRPKKRIRAPVDDQPRRNVRRRLRY